VPKSWRGQALFSAFLKTKKIKAKPLLLESEGQRVNKVLERGKEPKREKESKK